MHARLRSKLSYANVVATLALFLAIGGSSYAAIKITGKNVTDSSLTTRDIKNGSLLKRDFKAGQLAVGAPQVQGPEGAQGVQGVPGGHGEKGSPARPEPPVARSPTGSCWPTAVLRGQERRTIEGSNAAEISVAHSNNLEGVHCAAGDPGYNVLVTIYDISGATKDLGFEFSVN